LAKACRLLIEARNLASRIERKRIADELQAAKEKEEAERKKAEEKAKKAQKGKKKKAEEVVEEAAVEEVKEVVEAEAEEELKLQRECDMFYYFTDFPSNGSEYTALGKENQLINATFKVNEKFFIEDEEDEESVVDEQEALQR